ncbi:MAG: hypothetical protein WBG58_16030, partial [Ignavibacteriaceae bacterium]
MHTIFSNGKFHFGILLIILLFSFQQNSFSQFANSPLDPTTKDKFEDPMPVVKDLGLRYDVTGNNKNFTVKMAPTTQYLGIRDGVDTAFTTVWG